MTEDQIVDGLRAKAVARDQAIQAAEAKVAETAPTLPVAESDTGYAPYIGNEVAENQIFDYYEISPADRIMDAKPKLGSLLRWAATKVGDHDPLALMEYLKSYDTIYRLPPARRFQKLYEYSLLDTQVQKFNREVDVYGS